MSGGSKTVVNLLIGSCCSSSWRREAAVTGPKHEAAADDEGGVGELGAGGDAVTAEEAKHGTAGRVGRCEGEAESGGGTAAASERWRRWPCSPSWECC